MTGPRPRPFVLDIAPYTPGKARAAGFAHPVKLSANENPLGASPWAQKAYVEAAAELNLYPDSRVTNLRAAVARRFEVEPERLIFGCGSDELFNIACLTYIEPGDNVVQPAHGFAAWAIAAKAAGAEVRDAPERDLTVDVDALLARVDARTRIVFLANPANPTGTCLPFGEVRRLHAVLPPGVLLLLDAAYAEYAGQFPGYADGLELAREADNVFVTRTFSKAYGLAALRVGWGYGSAEAISAMDRIRPPFNVSRPAEAAAVAALGDEAFLNASQERVFHWRPIYTERLRAAGFEPVASATNFITFRIPEASGWTAPGLEEHLASRGVLIRGLMGYGLPEHLRVTIGNDEESATVLDLLDPRGAR